MSGNRGDNANLAADTKPEGAETTAGESPFTLAVSSEMVFRSLPVAERIRRIHELGFAVEIWDWTRHDIDALIRTCLLYTSDAADE